VQIKQINKIMKKQISLLFAIVMFIGVSVNAQSDKSKRASPPATVTQTLKSGAVVTIDYSQPSLKGRTIGKDIVPFGKVWRTGANEATIFETSKDLKIGGKMLPAGKYSLYTIPGEKEWTIIFNKTWNQSGMTYKEEQDVLRFTAKPEKSEKMMEKMTFEIERDGEVQLLWGDLEVDFKVK
jgi:hypothetical protein